MEVIRVFFEVGDLYFTHLISSVVAVQWLMMNSMVTSM